MFKTIENEKELNNVVNPKLNRPGIMIVINHEVLLLCFILLAVFILSTTLIYTLGIVDLKTTLDKSVTNYIK